MVIRRRFAVDAFFGDLPAHLPDQCRGRELQPCPCLRKLSKQASSYKQRGRFADNVRVWARVDGWIAMHVIELGK